MCHLWSFPFVLLSLIGSVTASSLRERNTLSIAPRTAYHFSNNYADSSCLQLVSGHMEVRYANTTSFYSRPCAAQQSIYGTVYYKEVLAEFDKFESCTAGLVGRWRAHRKSLQLCLFSSNILSGIIYWTTIFQSISRHRYDLLNSCWSLLFQARCLQSRRSTRDLWWRCNKSAAYFVSYEDQVCNYLFSADFLNDLHLFSITGKNTWTISIYPGDTCGKSGATVTPIPYLLYGGCLPVGHGDLNYAAFIAAPSLSCSPTFAPTVTPSAVPTKNKIGGHVKSCPKI